MKIFIEKNNCLPSPSATLSCSELHSLLIIGEFTLIGLVSTPATTSPAVQRSKHQASAHHDNGHMVTPPSITIIQSISLNGVKLILNINLNLSLISTASVSTGVYMYDSKAKKAVSFIAYLLKYCQAHLLLFHVFVKNKKALWCMPKKIN